MSVAVYTRQSVDKKDSISIDTQIDFCKREIFDEEYKVYSDRGFSGKNIERPQFQELLKDVKSGLVQKVIVYKLDRISRSLLDFTNIIDLFKKHEVSFVSCSEKFDTSTAMGKAMLSICMVFAELERETIQKRIKDNYYARGKQGLYMGGRAPYGFTKIETRVEGKKTYTFENNAEQLPFLIKMYELYANTDFSLGKVSDYLNNNNVPSAEGQPWDSSKISRILRSPIYVKSDADIYTYYKNKGCIISNDISEFISNNGLYLYGKRESNERKYTNVENHVLSLALHKGVIDSNMWLLCQYKLDSNKQIKNNGKGKHSWLSGLIKCGYCGYAVSVTMARGTKYFSCRGKTNYKICTGYNKTIYVDFIEDIVKKELLNKAKLLRDTNWKIKNIESSDANKMKIQILEIDKQIENLINQLSEANKVTIKYVNEKVNNLDNAKNLLLEEIKKITVNNSKSVPLEDVLNQADNWDILDFEQHKNLLGYFVNKINLTSEGINIDWKF